MHFADHDAPAPSPKSGERFKALLKEGDRDGAAEVLLRASRRAHRSLCLTFGSRRGGASFATDVIAEAIYTILERGARYDPSRGPLENWIGLVSLRIAQRRAKAADVQMRGERMYSQSWASAPRNKDDPSTTASSHEITQSIQSYIASLRDKHRAVVEADLASGGKANDTSLSSSLGVTKRRVWNIRQEARKDLQRRMQRWFDSNFRSAP